MAVSPLKKKRFQSTLRARHLFYIYIVRMSCALVFFRLPFFFFASSHSNERHCAITYLILLKSIVEERKKEDSSIFFLWFLGRDR